MSAASSARLPVLPTLIVALAVATMIGLGIWQLQRSAWKEDLLTRYRSAEALSAEVPFPRSPEEVEAALYRRSTLTCERVVSRRAGAGRSATGVSGWAQVVRCALDGGDEAEIALGWTRRAIEPEWTGGTVSGWVAPAGENARLVAARPLAGLEPLARPDPNDLPNNHLSYAVQWFFFAITAAAIYWLALRRKRRGTS